MKTTRARFPALFAIALSNGGKERFIAFYELVMNFRKIDKKQGVSE
jgi:hypothetical protein